MSSPRRAVLSVVCVLIVAVIGVLLALSSLPGTQSRFEWNPHGTSLSSQISFPLSATTPPSIDIWVDCSAITASNSQFDRTLVRTTPMDVANGLRLIASKQQAWAAIGPNAIANTEVALSSCREQVHLSYNAATQSLAISNGVDNRQVSVADVVTNSGEGPLRPVVSGLEADPSVKDQTSVVLVTAQTTVDWPVWKTILAVIAMMLIVLSVLLIGPARLGIGRIRSALRVALRGARWAWDDTAILAASIISWLIIAPGFDEGWVTATIRSFPQLGFFSNYYDEDAAAQLQGFWWSWVSQLWIGWSQLPILLMRLPSLVIFVASWWFLRRILLERLLPLPEFRAQRWLIVLAVLPFVLSFVPTLRPEIALAGLLSFQLVLVYAYYRRRSVWLLALMGAVGGFGIAVHQSGVCVAAAALACIPWFVEWARRQDRRTVISSVLIVGGTLAGSTVVLLMLHANIWFALESAQHFSEENSHSRFLMEASRFDILFTDERVPPVRAFAVIIVYLSAAAFLLRRRRALNSAASAVGWASFAALASLTITASKWPWHMLSVFPAMVLLLVIFLRDADLRVGWPRVRWAVVAVAAAILGVYSALTVGSFEPMANIGIDFAAQSSGLIYRSALPLIILGLVALVLFVVKRKAWTTRRWAIVSSTLIVAWLLMISVLPAISVFVANPANSWAAVNVSSLTNPCGVGGDARYQIPTVTSALKIQSVEPLSVPAKAQLSADDPVGKHPPVLGTFVFTAQGLQSGLTATPWFQVSADHPMISWIDVASAAKASFEIQWRDASGAGLVSDPVQFLHTSDMWLRQDLTPPAGAAQVRLVWNTNQGVRSVTGPVAVEASATLAQLAGNQPVFISPNLVPWASCFQLPSIRTGVFQDSNWSLGLYLNSAVYPVGYSIASEMVCINPSQDMQSRMCIYRISNPSSVGLTRTDLPMSK